MAFMGIPFDSRQQQAEDGSFYEDREVFSEDIANYFGFLSSNGICLKEGEEFSNQFLVQKGTGAQVILNPGTVKIQGHMGWITEQEIVVAESGGSLPRYDTAVIELNLTTSVRNFVFKLVKGTEASSPTPPTLTRTENVYQLGVANIYRAANSTVLGTITDTRLDGDRCGISTVSVPNLSSQTLLDWQNILSTITSLDDILQLQAKSPIAGELTPSGAINNLGLKGAITETLLWENANPTSSFAAQTIGLDLSEYDSVEIFTALSTNGTIHRVDKAKKGYSCRILDYYNPTSTSNYLDLLNRSAAVNNNGVKFGTANSKQTNSTEATENNKYMIPLKIYGIKEVQ